MNLCCNFIVEGGLRPFRWHHLEREQLNQIASELTELNNDFKRQKPTTFDLGEDS